MFPSLISVKPQSLLPMTAAHRTTGTAPLAVHFSAVDRTVTARDTSNITGIITGHTNNVSPVGTGTLAFTAGTAGNDLLTSLTSQWNCDEASGDVLDGHGVHHLTDNNTVTSEAGKIGNARTFTAVNSEYAQRSHHADFSPGNSSFGISLWVKIASATQMTAFSKWNTTSNKREWQLYTTVTGAPKFEMSGDGTSGTLTSVTWGSNLSVGVWYHITAWYDAVADLMGIAVDNGTPVTAAQTTGAGVAVPTANLNLGARGGPGNFFDGAIDEVGYWAKALDASARTALYNAGAGLAYGSFDSGASDGSITYSAPGDSAGTPLTLTADLQALRLYSNNATDWLYMDVDYSALPVANQSDTVTITQYRTTGVVQPSQTVVAGDPDYGSQAYYWWFNDANAITYSYTEQARNSNTCWGAPVTAHLFDQPGNYTVDLSVWESDGTRNDYQQTITVTDQEDTATVYYVDATLGSDSNDGLAPTDQGGGVGPLQTFDAATAKITANDIVIKFKRGESYSTSATKLVSFDDITITSYYNADGSDDTGQALPALSQTGTGATFTVDDGKTGFKCCHLSVTGAGATASGGFISLGQATPHSNVLIYDIVCTALTGITIHSGGTLNWGNKHTFVVNCHAHDLNGTGGNGLFIELIEGAVLGTHVDTMTGSTEHCCRVLGHDEGVVADNDFRVPNTAKLALTMRSIPWNQVNGTATANYDKENSYSAILRNKCIGVAGTAAFAVSTIGAGDDARNAHVICFGNEIHSDSTAAVWMRGYHTQFINNVVRNATADAVQIAREGVEPTPLHHRVYGNTLINDRSSGVTNQSGVTMIGVDADTASDIFSPAVSSNIVWNNGTTDTWVWDTLRTPNAELTADYNLQDNGTNWSNDQPDGGSATQRDLATTISALGQDTNSATGSALFTAPASDDYTLQAGSNAIAAGEAALLAWMRLDRAGLLRVTTVDCGAHQRGAAAPSAP